MDLVKITWLDAEDYSEGTWASKDEIAAFTDKHCVVESVGWIVKRTRHYITIAGDFTPDPDTAGRIIKIPKKMIQRIEALQLTQKDESPVN